MDEVSINVSSRGDEVIVRLQALDPKVLEHDATLSIRRLVSVKKSRGVDSLKTLLEYPVTWSSSTFDVSFSSSELQIYSYSGDTVDIRLEAFLKIDDAWIFDTKIRHDFDLPLPGKEVDLKSALDVISPKDEYTLRGNFAALPNPSKFMILAAVAFALGGIALPIFVGIFELMNPGAIRHLTGLNVPVLVLLIGYAIILMFGLFRVHSLIMSQLRRYLALKSGPRMNEPIAPEDRVLVSELLMSRATSKLKDVTVRVVAANVEMGQYKTGTGTDVRTVSYSSPVRGLVLYEKTIERVAAGSSIESHLIGDVVSFDPAFDHLYPPTPRTSTHGIDVVWEVQIIHPQFVDHELKGSSNIFDYRDFLKDGHGDGAPEKTDTQDLW